MQEGKVPIADGPIQTRDNLHEFKTSYNKAHPNDRLKTLAETIEKLIEIATIEVPRLNELVSQKNAKIGNLEGKIEWMKPFMDKCEKKAEGIYELEGKTK
ncbi:MAG: hypothetical protein ABFC34_16965 [Methanobacterium sp.]